MDRNSPPQADRDWLFPGGSNSFGDPRQSAGTYVRGWNVVCRGGVVQTRPGTRVVAALPPGRPQALVEFSPLRGHKQLVAVIEGRVYVLEHPFTRWRLLPNIQLSARAEVVYHARCVQTTEQLADGSVGFLASPRRVLVLQDGLSPAAWYDGYDHGNDRSVDGIPMGTRMAWVENRLWVARGNQVYASDFANPRSFVERYYLGEADSLIYPDDIMALAATYNAGRGEMQLVVWTRVETYLVSASIPRTSWPTTANFSRRLFGLGCISQRSVIEHEGKLWWMTADGMTSLDETAQSQITAATPVIDRAMSWSRESMDTRDNRAAGVSAHGYVLMSVGYADQSNTHTWCLDTAVTHPPTTAWASVWTGFAPVEWAVIGDDGAQRVFALCTKDSGENLLLEAFTGSQRDSGQSIECAVELRTYVGPTPQAKWFQFADLQLSDISGEVESAVSWRGLSRGRYRRCFRSIAKAARGCFDPSFEAHDDATIEAFGRQTRRYSTEEPAEIPATALDDESARRGDIDVGFSFLVQWCGVAALREFGVVYRPFNERIAGLPSTDETEETVVRWDGSQAARDVLAATPGIEVYSAQWTANAEWDPALSAVAVRRSLVSEASALRMAKEAAAAQIDYWRERLAPPILGGLA